MGELTLFVLKVGFLILMWVFVFVVLFALRSDLFGQKVRKLPATPAAGPSFAPAAAAPAPVKPKAAPAQTGTATRLVVTAGAKEGLEISLPSELLTIGRSSESDLVIRDDYTSTHHARLIVGVNGWMIEDLDSTNGTTLDGTKVTSPTLVPLGTPVTIGTTTFELRR
jgi:pSer/pThr/pTyr-binding forkhead associated (FHA) protein